MEIDHCGSFSSIHPSSELMYSVIRATWNLQVNQLWSIFMNFPIPIHNMTNRCGVSHKSSSTKRLSHPYFPAQLNIPHDIFSYAATLSSSVIHFWRGTPGITQFLRIICHPIFIAVWAFLKLQWLAQRDAIISGQNKVTFFSKKFCFAQKGKVFFATLLFRWLFAYFGCFFKVPGGRNTLDITESSSKVIVLLWLTC